MEKDKEINNKIKQRHFFNAKAIPQSGHGSSFSATFVAKGIQDVIKDGHEM